MLAVKYAAIVIFAVRPPPCWWRPSAPVVGLALFGGGPVTLLSGTPGLARREGWLRLLAICAYLTVALCALGAIGLFVSTLTEQPIGATIAIVMLTRGELHPRLASHSWTGCTRTCSPIGGLSFGDLLRDPIATGRPALRRALRGWATCVIFLTAAWARFCNRDVTS